MMVTRREVVAVAFRWMGTRFEHQASKRGVGTDCIGLVVGVARDLEMPEAEEFASDLMIRGYGREPDPGMLLDACSRYLNPCREPVAGDILLFRFKAEPQHFALISAPGYMIHAYAQAHQVVENRINDWWYSRKVAAFSYRGIA